MVTRRLSAILILILVSVAAGGIACKKSDPAKPEPFKPAGEFPLPGVDGRIDHLSADVAGMRLFVAALGNNSVEVINLKNGQRLRTITGLKQPQGILYVPGVNRLVVSCAADGSCNVFDGSTYELLHTTILGSDADNMRYDSVAGMVYVGYGAGALGVFDPLSGAVDTAKEVKLDGHPEAFQFETQTKRIYVNVPNTKCVAVVSREPGARNMYRPMTDVLENYPMALDETNHRLFVGCREPANLLVMDTGRGIFTATLPCAGDADEVFYDAARKRVYISGGIGYITTFQQKDADNYEELPRVNTASGGRTSLFVPELGKLYVAIPKQGTRSAMIKVYEVQ